MITLQVKPTWSPGLRPELLLVDFVKTRFEYFFAQRCSENCCAFEGQHSEVPICNVNTLERLGLALLSLAQLLNFLILTTATTSAVGILASAVTSSCFVNCQLTAQALGKPQTPYKVLFTGSLKLACLQLCNTQWDINTIECFLRNGKEGLATVTGSID